LADHVYLIDCQALIHRPYPSYQSSQMVLTQLASFLSTLFSDAGILKIVFDFQTSDEHVLRNLNAGIAHYQISI
jgi:hypothetical protein